jgi:hypothetical protein
MKPELKINLFHLKLFSQIFGHSHEKLEHCYSRHDLWRQSEPPCHNQFPLQFCTNVSWGKIKSANSGKSVKNRCSPLCSQNSWLQRCFLCPSALPTGVTTHSALVPYQLSPKCSLPQRLCIEEFGVEVFTQFACDYLVWDKQKNIAPEHRHIGINGSGSNGKVQLKL